VEKHLGNQFFGTTFQRRRYVEPGVRAYPNPAATLVISDKSLRWSPPVIYLFSFSMHKETEVFFDEIVKVVVKSFGKAIGLDVQTRYQLHHLCYFRGLDEVAHLLAGNGVIVEGMDILSSL
jgi:hypothetical protein